ncbi:MAG: glycosyltransferase [Sandaracinus sp.]|nr:glycosyltransferase [Sandaracinus sp.]
MPVADVDEAGLLDHVFGALARGEGGWIVTANLDILRRYALDSDCRALYDAAEIRVADGMPLVWASRVAGRPLPERIAGSTLTLDLAERAAREGRSLYLLGGDPGTAAACRASLESRFAGLTIAGTSSPRVGSPANWAEVERIAASIEGDPDIVLVGLGSPKQEFLIQKLRQRFPKTWFMGVGITFSFVAGEVARAPEWMQRAGVEWVHRMVQDPGRLVRRYLIEDLPFAGVLFASAVRDRLR